MKKQTRTLLWGVLVVILLVGVAQYILRNQSNLSLPNFSARNFLQPEESAVSPAEVVTTETVTIDFGNGRKLVGEVATQSAYQALLEVAKNNNLEVSAKQYKYGVLVTKIGTVANNQDSAWMYSVNGKPGQIAADRYVIYPKDKVEWVYQRINQ